MSSSNWTVQGTVLLALLFGACAAPPPPPPPPPIDARQLSMRTQSNSELGESVQIIFNWRARELGAGRFSGQGALRLQPTHHARLDLFQERTLETVAMVALVGGELRMPNEVPEGLIPPPRMLWGLLGVMWPGTGAGLVGDRAERMDDGRLRLRFTYENGEELRYYLNGGRIEEVHLFESGDLVERVELTLSEDSRYPAEALYQDLRESRELELTRELVEVVESFPQDIWDPR